MHFADSFIQSDFRPIHSKDNNNNYKVLKTVILHKYNDNNTPEQNCWNNFQNNSFHLKDDKSPPDFKELKFKAADNKTVAIL